MRRVDHIRSFISILLIVFLSASIISGSFNDSSRDTRVLAFAKKEDAPARSAMQILFEEKEENRSEKGRGFTESYNTFFFICLISNPVLCSNAGTPHYIISHYSLFGNAPGVPLYLAKRVLLI